VAFSLRTYVFAFLADEPLRRMVEREINARLKGYTMRIGHLELHPISLSLGLRDTVILQHPDLERPILRLPRLSAGLHWTALLQGRVPSDVEVDSPAAHVDRTQLIRLLDDPIPLNEKGRQEVLQALHSRQLNELVVRNGSLTYVEEGDTRPLTLSRVEFLADRNLVFENFANQFTEGTATARLTGRCMGSGAITVSAAFRPETKRADFDLEARIEDTDLRDDERSATGPRQGRCRLGRFLGVRRGACHEWAG
jgi:hypothetical protein